MGFSKTLLTLFLVMFAASVSTADPLRLEKKVIKDAKRYYDLEVSYPRTGHAAIDRELETWARALAKEFVDSAVDAHGQQPWTAEVSYEVPRNDGAVLSLLFTYYMYTGGAHPNSSLHSFYFLLPDGYNAAIGEVFSLRGISRISDISIAQLKRDIGGPDGMSDTDWIRRGAGPNGYNFRNFVLLPQELVLHFDAYQVAAYAAGPQEVHIPLAKLRDTMRLDARAPSASFDCGLARTTIEQAICSTRDLARLDRQLGDAYQNKLTWAYDESERTTIRQQQRAWLQLRDLTCFSARSNLAACLMPVYQKRLAQLTAN
ncbi:MAG: DUF4163 domain-containing protein [Micropepsaceae bacterium]